MRPPPRIVIKGAAFALMISLFVAFVYRVDFRVAVLQGLFPDQSELVYGRVSLPILVLQHVHLVAISSLAATVAGLSVGIFVTRGIGKDFLPLARDLSSLAQTFPPAAILALAFPILGFGFRPTVAALFIFGLLPVVNNTISGIEAVDAGLVEASVGQGMRPRQVLFRTELPLAARVIVAGIRTSVIINIGTATIGATIGAGGLGTIIVAGLVRNNTAFVLSGALTAAGLALIADWLFARIESLFYDPRERTAG
ncbi:MAG: ABC transporter permease [Spirochaetales bacterium]